MKRVTDQQYILLAAIQQVDNIVSLLEENEWKDFMYQHLSPVGMNLNVNYPIWRTTDETGKLLSNHTLHKYNRLSRPIFAQAIAYSSLPVVSAIGLTVMLASFITLATIAVIR